MSTPTGAALSEFDDDLDNEFDDDDSSSTSTTRPGELAAAAAASSTKGGPQLIPSIGFVPGTKVPLEAAFSFTSGLAGMIFFLFLL